MGGLNDVSPRESGLTTAVGQTGADVVGGLEIKRNYLDEHTDLFVERLLGVLEPA